MFQVRGFQMARQSVKACGRNLQRDGQTHTHTPTHIQNTEVKTKTSVGQLAQQPPKYRYDHYPKRAGYPCFAADKTKKLHIKL